MLHKGLCTQSYHKNMAQSTPKIGVFTHHRAGIMTVGLHYKIIIKHLFLTSLETQGRKKLTIMDGNVNIINWFEVPANDIARAKKFYEHIFSVKLSDMDMMGMKMAFFPAENMNGKVSGGIVQGPMHKPSADGAKIYFNGNPDLGVALGKVEAAGGKVLMPKTKINDEVGYMAFFADTEGNTVALHSSN
jgi:uncharacterized protein